MADRGGRGFDRGGRGGDRGGRGGDRGGRGFDRGGRGGDRGGRGGGRGGAGTTFNRPAPPDMSTVPSLDISQLPLLDLGKGAAQPLLFGGNRVAKSAEMPTAAAPAAKAGAASAAKVARKEGLSAEEVAKRQAEFEKARDMVQQQLENVKAMKASAPKQGAPQIFVNNFPVKCDLNTSFYQYRITCEPDIPNRKAKKSFVDRALAQLESKYNAKAISSNNLIFAQQPIHNIKEQDKTKKDKEQVTLTMREKPVVINFIFTRTVENAKGLTTEAYGVLATVLREAFDTAGMVKIGGKYFDTSAKYSTMITVDGSQQKDAGMCIASGLNITLYPTGRGLMLNVDLAMRVARKDRVIDTINAAKEYARQTNSDFKEVVKAEIVGAVCATTYSLQSRKQTFNVAEVRFDVNPGTEIPGAKEKITFAAYMKQHHNLTVNDMTQPMLLFRSQREIDREGKPVERWYIPEFCQLVGQSNKQRGEAQLQQDLKRACLLTPPERFGYICQFMGKISANSAFQAVLQKWKMMLDPRITRVPLKQMAMPAITLQGNDRQRSWLVNRALNAPTLQISKWCVLHPDRMDTGALNGFLGSLNSELNKLGVRLPAPQFASYRSDRDPGRWGRNLANTLGELEEDVQFVLVVLNDNNDQNYFMVKETSLKDWNIPSQCVLQRNAMTSDPRKLSNITSRIAGQVVVKLGGALWATTKPVPGSEGMVLIGLSTASGQGASALAMVAARAEDNVPIASVCGTFTGDATSAIQQCLAKVVGAYKAQFRNAPKGLFVFRPGMNEGDVPNIINKEVIPTQQFCQQEKMSLIFLNSLKRCTIRFFLLGGQGTSTPPGSLVDDFLTPPTGFTFFCVPQVCNQGTATAMKFSVLSNSTPNSFGPDAIETVVFNQCHSFYGWWGATREPGVVMYSERLAEFHAKTSVKTKPAPDTVGVRVL